MQKLGELIQTDDWKSEKHVPVIECPDAVKSGELFEVKISIGKEIAHPNTTEHHINWIQLYFKPDDDKFSYQVANLEFCAHGASTRGADQGPVYTHHGASAILKIQSSGTLHALSHCNIHGLWENTKAIKAE